MPKRNPAAALASLEPGEPDWVAEATAVAQLAQQHNTDPRSVLHDAYRVSRCLRYLAAGNYRSVAALNAGFTRQTLHNLELWAKQGHIPSIALFDSVERAEAWSEATLVANVKRASELPQFWAAGMTTLERRHPERWGRRTEDSSAPKVVVQIGVRDGDVTVRLGESASAQHTLAPDPSPALVAESVQA